MVGLEEAGIVTRVIDGRTHRLALQPDALADTAEWIDSQRTRWERLFDVVGEYLEERRSADDRARRPGAANRADL